MKIYLRDSRLENSGWKKSLEKVFGSEQVDANSHGTVIESSADQNLLAILFLHPDSDSNRDAWIQSWANGESHYLILVHGEGRYDYHNKIERVLPCYWNASEFEDPTNKQIRSFITQIKAGDPSKIKWDLLQPKDVETRLAAHIVCQAKEMCGEAETIQIHGFAVHAPSVDLVGKAKAILREIDDDPAYVDAVTKFLEALTPQPEA